MKLIIGSQPRYFSTLTVVITPSLAYEEANQRSEKLVGVVKQAIQEALARTEFKNSEVEVTAVTGK